MRLIFKHRSFWIANNVLFIVVHLIGLSLLLSGASLLGNPLLLIWVLLLVIHTLEIPVAFSSTKENPQPPLRTIVMTVLFGFTWWLPVRLGIYGRRPVPR